MRKSGRTHRNQHAGQTVTRTTQVEKEHGRMTDNRPRLEMQAWRESIVQAFMRVEDTVYAGLGTLLAAIALVLLVAVAVALVRAILGDALPDRAVELLDRILLILMIVELLYTVQVSFREHALVPEPFLIVGLIAAVRRLLVLTAEFARFLEKGNGGFRGARFDWGCLPGRFVLPAAPSAI